MLTHDNIMCTYSMCNTLVCVCTCMHSLWHSEALCWKKPFQVQQRWAPIRASPLGMYWSMCCQETSSCQAWSLESRTKRFATYSCTLHVPRDQWWHWTLSSLPQTQQSLLLIDEQELSNRYKIGVLYCKPGDSTEEDLYNNGEWMIWRTFSASVVAMVQMDDWN